MNNDTMRDWLSVSQMVATENLKTWRGKPVTQNTLQQWCARTLNGEAEILIGGDGEPMVIRKGVQFWIHKDVWRTYRVPRPGRPWDREQ